MSAYIGVHVRCSTVSVTLFEGMVTFFPAMMQDAKTMNAHGVMRECIDIKYAKWTNVEHFGAIARPSCCHSNGRYKQNMI